MLHGSNPSSLFNQGFVVAVLVLLLSLAMFGTLLCLKGLFWDDWTVGVRTFVVGAPLSM